MKTFRIEGAMLTDRGLARSSNEDRVGYSDRSDPSGRLESVIAIVADGMGGHAAGEVASELAVEIILRGGLGDGDTAPPTRLEACILAANEAILAESRQQTECAGMGTTVTVLIFEADRAWIAQVGDSRAYRVRGSTITRLTEDQTLVRQLVREGMITEAEAERHPDRNVVLQAVGTSPTLEPVVDRQGLPLEDGDIFVLCSDGLSNELDDEAIREACDHPSAFAVCERLIADALSRGAHDNVSVGVFFVRAADGSAEVVSTRVIEGMPEIASAPTRNLPMETGPW